MEINKMIKWYRDEIEKLRKTLRDCDANLNIKNRYGRKNLVDYKP